jgi:hypothetical protein
MYVTYLEFPPEALPRYKFRQLIKYLQAFPDSKLFFRGYKGRKLYFVFENKAKADIFLQEVQAMFERNNVETKKTQE